MRQPIRSFALGVATLACVALAGNAFAGLVGAVREPVAPRPVAKWRIKPSVAPLSGGAETPPSNDQCAGAIPISCGNISLSGNTYMATNDYDFADTTLSCTSYSAGGHDVVYRLDALAGDSLWVHYQSTADASIYLVTDCSDVQHTCKAGADDNRQGIAEDLRYGFKSSGTYYLVLDSYGADSYGEWTLVGQFLSCGLHPPANDRCDTATPLYCGAFGYAGNTVAATNDYSFASVPGSCVGSFAQGRDVAFSMDVNAGDSLAVSYTSSANGVMYVMADCPPPGTAVNCVVGANAQPAGGMETINFRFTYSGTYYLVLDSDGANTDGGWTMMGTITCGQNAPTNNTCANATFLSCGPFALSGDNTLATPDYDPTDLGCTGFSEPGPDVVYRVDAAPGDSLWCDYAFVHQPGKDDIDAAIYLVTDCANIPGTCVAGVDEVGSGQQEHLRYKFTTRGTYYMILDSYDAIATGPWSANGALVCPANVAGVGDRADGRAVSLSAAYPNPFHSASTLRFTLPARAHAVLRIHDITGRVVRTLADTEFGAGPQSVTWDAHDDAGRSLPGGTYFARLDVAGVLVSRTLVFVH